MPTIPRWPIHGRAERAALLGVLRQPDWSRAGGQAVDTFEREFAAYVGARSVLGVTNGTQAMELALALHDVGPGDEVIVPAFTFLSPALAVRRMGAVPVPVDVDPVTYCMSAEAAEAAVTGRTRAIIPVHMAGHAADVAGIAALAERRRITLIHDAAHAPGTAWEGRPLPAYGGTVCYSFQNLKLLTAGEGGALAFSDSALRDRAFEMHNVARGPVAASYDHSGAAWSNLRMSEFHAALLSAQLNRLPAQNRRRELRARQLDDLIAAIPDVVPQGHDPRCTVHAHYMYMFALHGRHAETGVRDHLLQVLRGHGVPASIGFPVVYRTGAFWAGRRAETKATGRLAETETAGRRAEDDAVRAVAGKCPVAEDLASNTIWLHHRVLLAGRRDMKEIADIVRGAVHG